MITSGKHADSGRTDTHSGSNAYATGADANTVNARAGTANCATNVTRAGTSSTDTNATRAARSSATSTSTGPGKSLTGHQHNEGHNCKNAAKHARSCYCEFLNVQHLSFHI